MIPSECERSKSTGPLGPHAAVRRWAAYSSNHEFQQFNLTT
jgi:hypothetical protein